LSFVIAGPRRFRAIQLTGIDMKTMKPEEMANEK
jgi:hypothetical protein